MRPSPDPIARAAARLSGLGRPALLLAGIWALGLIALGAVVAFESRADQTRRAQVVIAHRRGGNVAVHGAMLPAVNGREDCGVFQAPVGAGLPPGWVDPPRGPADEVWRWPCP